MVKLTHRVIYFDLSPVYQALRAPMTKAGGDSVDFYLSIGEYDHLVRQIVLLELLTRTGHITFCSAQLALKRYARDMDFILCFPQAFNLLESELGNSRDVFHAVEDAIPVPINPYTMMEPVTGPIWAFITGA
ncbi:hypothetical protein BIZ82_gp012 [Erwinia phage vB_EamM_EarlPhillipIV]|nr:hypothetical protein BIZ82_gp012 [Erwinia phage vB_EamM_EarlPhillipIV]ANZ48862.1 hypothetical protein EARLPHILLIPIV_12 [Erwinia phage vB_EamM_EarlPhillipIV]